MNSDYEVQINIKDLMFAILYKWRPIILIAIIFGILIGSYKIGSGILKQKDEEYIAEIQEKYDEDIDQYEKDLVNYDREISNIKANLESQEKYVEESVIMNINPYDKWTATADIFVTMIEDEGQQALKVLTVDYADSIVKAYASAVQHGECLNGLSKKLELKKEYIKELIDVSMDYNSNMLNISISYTDKAGAKEILDTILNSMEDMHLEISEYLGDHTINIMNNNVSSSTDQNLANKQKQTTDSIADLQDSLDEKEKAQEDLEKPKTPEELSKRTLLKSAIKFGVLGGIFGAFLTIFYICIVYMMSNKLKFADEIKERYGVKVLGIFSQPIKKRAFFGIDNWLASLEGRESNPEDFVYNMIAVNTRNYLGDYKKVMITGSVSDDILETVAQRMRENHADIDFAIGSDMNKSVETLEKLPEFDSVILVEKRGISKHNDIQNEMETICSLNKMVIGCVVY